MEGLSLLVWKENLDSKDVVWVIRLANKRKLGAGLEAGESLLSTMKVVNADDGNENGRYSFQSDVERSCITLP